MKRNHITILIGFLFLFLFKRTLLPIDSHPFYLLTNIIGTILILIGLGKSNYIALSYIGLNGIVYFLSIFEGLSIRLPLFFYSLLYIFPIAALLYYLGTNPINSKQVPTIKKTITFCFILAIVAIFIFSTGFFLSFSLPFVAGVVVLTHILCVIGVLLLLVYSIKLSKEEIQR